ncbi:hypothetical protein [Nostocoides sp. Soil756]|jgi:hypothetical protein|uniref:hypothetical protein n=1 Tax=Nostocoides sp. Soil756 TaxID=1736399 RepID=UPI0007018729|nr:hypothetical protein [Tetrasphaera sp. Soil756]KRE62030.1 hypothetical protein ASG78_02880 [Tetrasphaera sp. Soil756]
MKWERARPAVFLLLTFVALLSMVTSTLRLVVPPGLAVRIGHNSESLLWVLLVIALVEIVRPRVIGRTWVVGMLVAVLLVVTGLLLARADWPSSVVTLNEPVVGSGLMLAYLMLSRPIRHPAWIVLVFVLLIAAFYRTDLVIDQSESLVPMVIAPVALDVVDRTILEPWLLDRRQLRLFWLGVLVLIGVFFMLVAPWARARMDNPLDLTIDYAQRASEAYWGWILLHLYFGYARPPSERRQLAGNASGHSRTGSS